jgi:Lipocalin-like domain
VCFATPLFSKEKIMSQINTLTAISASLLFSVFVMSSGNVAAQDAKSLVGTWTIVSTDTIDASGQRAATFGPNPRGSLIFTASGRYSLILARTTLPKFASDNRTKGTAEENQAIVSGSLSHFGKYTVDEKDKTFMFHVETSTYPNWDGTSQKRPFTVSGDELKYNTVGASGGGTVELVWKRVK